MKKASKKTPSKYNKKITKKGASKSSSWVIPKPTELQKIFADNKKDKDTQKELDAVYSKISSAMVDSFQMFIENNVAAGTNANWFEFKIKSDLFYLSPKDDEYLEKIKTKVLSLWKNYNVDVNRKFDTYTIRLSW